MATKIKILLIEDDIIDAEIVTRVLSQVGQTLFDITNVVTLREATRSVEREVFQTIIMDLGLPDNEGLDGAKQLLSLVPQTPLIILTGSDEPDLMLRAIEIGADEFLSKENLNGAKLARTIRLASKRKGRWIQVQDSNDDISSPFLASRLFELLKTASLEVQDKIEELQASDISVNQSVLLTQAQESLETKLETARQLMRGLDEPNVSSSETETASV